MAAYVDVFGDLDSTHFDGWKMGLGACDGEVNDCSGKAIL